MEAIKQRGVIVSGPELTFSCPPEGGALALAPGVVINAPFEPVGAVAPQTMPAGLAAHYRYAGPYDRLAEAWMRLNAWVRKQGVENAGLGWEIYSDPDLPITDLYSMVKHV